MSTVPGSAETPVNPAAPVPTPAKPAAPARTPLFSAEAWSPLKVPLFRSLWVATSIAQIGTWVREAAGPTLMANLTSGWANQPEMVARVLVFSNLPIMLLSLFAGALADVLDRRKWLIITQVWMVIVSALLGVLTIMGAIHPISLLVLTFMLGIGTAAFGPALQAVLPELVPAQQFALAINLNSIALNVARAIGPALFIVVVWFVPGPKGAGVSFLLTALTFVGAVWVLLRWKRPPQRAAVAGEGFFTGIKAGVRYTLHSPAQLAILLRVVCFIVPALVIWSQVPIIAKNHLHVVTPLSAAATAVEKAAQARQIQQFSALLFAFVGIGAIFGVLIMPGLHKRYKIDPVVNGCTLLFAAGLVALSFVHTLWAAAPILVFLGINWVIIPTNFNTATQKSVPPWVKGRAISFYLTVLFGSFSIGGAIWGRVTTEADIGTSLLFGGLSMAALLLLAPFFPLTLNEGLDLTPAFKPGQPAGAGALLASMPQPAPAVAGDAPPAEGAALVAPAAPPRGPVEVAIEYFVPYARRAEFLAAMELLGKQRRRNGARGWILEHHAGERYVERFRFGSYAELPRQAGRMSKADLALHERITAMHAGPTPPAIRHGPAEVPTMLQWGVAHAAYATERVFQETAAAVGRIAPLKKR